MSGVIHIPCSIVGCSGEFVLVASVIKQCINGFVTLSEMHITTFGNIKLKSQSLDQLDRSYRQSFSAGPLNLAEA